MKMANLDKVMSMLSQKEGSCTKNVQQIREFLSSSNRGQQLREFVVRVDIPSSAGREDKRRFDKQGLKV